MSVLLPAAESCLLNIINGLVFVAFENSNVSLYLLHAPPKMMKQPLRYHSPFVNFN